MTKQQYRKKVISEPVYEVQYVDNNDRVCSFKSTKSMLESHKKLMTNNKYIKSFSVQPILKKE